MKPTTFITVILALALIMSIIPVWEHLDIQAAETVKVLTPDQNYNSGVQAGLKIGRREGVEIGYKAFRQMFKDKKNRNEYLKRLVATIQEQKAWEKRIIGK